jgi:hypothetical protein
MVQELIPVGLHSDDREVNIYSHFRLTWNDWLDRQDLTKDNIQVEPRRLFVNKYTNIYHIKCSRKVKKTKASDLLKTQSPTYEIKYRVV